MTGFEVFESAVRVRCSLLYSFVVLFRSLSRRKNVVALDEAGPMITPLETLCRDCDRWRPPDAEDAWRAVSPESRFLPASRNSFDQLMGWTALPPPRQAGSPNPLRRRQI